MAGQYDPKFERALEQLLTAAADTAEFAAGTPTGRSRQASIRRLAGALEELHRAAAAVVLSSAVIEARTRNAVELRSTA